MRNREHNLMVFPPPEARVSMERNQSIKWTPAAGATDIFLYSSRYMTTVVLVILESDTSGMTQSHTLSVSVVIIG